MSEFALENIVKMIILIVVAVVIISLIMTFSQDIINWWDEFTGKREKPPPKAVVIEKASFNSEEVANLIEGCWSSNLNRQEDNECYFLLGSFSGVSKDLIIAAINSNVMDPAKAIFEVDTITNALVITYDNYRREVQSEAIVIKGR